MCGGAKIGVNRAGLGEGMGEQVQSTSWGRVGDDYEPQACTPGRVNWFSAGD